MCFVVSNSPLKHLANKRSQTLGTLEARAQNPFARVNVYLGRYIPSQPKLNHKEDAGFIDALT